MTTVRLEPFESTFWWSIGGGGLTIAASRTGNGFQKLGVTDYTTRIPTALESTQITVGMAFKVSALTSAQTVLQLKSDAAVTGHLCVSVETTGALSLRRGANTSAVLLGSLTAAGTIVANTWYYLEITAILGDGTTGSATVALDGVNVIGPLTSIDTKNAGTKTVFDSLGLGGGNSGLTTYHDDMYIATGASEPFRGPQSITPPTDIISARNQMRTAIAVTPAVIHNVRNVRHSLRVAVIPDPPATGLSVKAWDGSAFVDSAVKVWTGSAFVDADVKVWDGAAFVGGSAPVLNCTEVLHEPFHSLNRWTSLSAATLVAGRTGMGLRTNNSNGGNARFTIPASQDSQYITVGMAYNKSAHVGDTSIFVLQGDDVSITHINVRAGTAGRLNVVYGASVTVSASTAMQLSVSTWHYIECQARLHDTLGFIIIKVDGIEVMNLTGIDTRNGGTKATFDGVSLRGGLSVSALFDDLYISTGPDCVMLGDHVESSPDVLMEPFNNLTNAGWVNGGATIVPGRTGNGAEMTLNSNSLSYVIQAAYHSQWITFGFAYRTLSLANSIDLFRCYSESIMQMRIRVFPDGSLDLRRSNTVIATTGPGYVTVGVWSYIEAQFKLGDAGVGSYELRVNGVTVLGPTIADTNGSSVGLLWGSIDMQPGINVAGGAVYDDMYVTMGAGAPFKGDITITAP